MSPLRVIVLVHGGPESIEAIRARSLARRAPSGAVRFVYREGSRLTTLRAWALELKQHRPDLVYVLNTALPGAPLAVWKKMAAGIPFILDTGDVIEEMARRSGIGAGWRLPLLSLIEQSAWNHATRIVVRGTRHSEYLQQLGLKSTLIRDGYSEQQVVAPSTVHALRTKLGLEDRIVVGLMGSLVWSPRLQICYGWDLVQALPSLRDLPVTGLIIGDGNGRSWLEAEARKLGVVDRLIFTGRIPYAQVPTYMRLLDVALSTQTNNLPGQVRTTGKVPEYMAAGCHILASRVGEAGILLPEAMLLPFEGEVDAAYPQRLADRVRHLVLNPQDREIRHTLPAIASSLCSYEVLSREWMSVVDDVLMETGNSRLSV